MALLDFPFAVICMTGIHCEAANWSFIALLHKLHSSEIKLYCQIVVGTTNEPLYMVVGYGDEDFH